MRKALMGLILAATVMTPIAAEAQNRDRVGRNQRVEQSSGSESEDRQARRAERRTQRQQTQAQPQPQPQAQPQTEQPAPQIRAFNRRGERNLSRSNNGGISATGQDQSGNWRNERRENRQERREERRDWRQDRREDRQQWQNDGRQNRSEWRQERREERRDWRQDRRGDRRDWRSDRRESRRDWRREWNRNHWRGDRRYDWQSWRFRNRGLFRLSRYYSPYRNHSYSRFSIGLFLQPLFYSQNYWIGDPWQYRLPPAPPGTRWIRYYDDVLLVDTWSGEVVDVIHDFFW